MNLVEMRHTTAANVEGSMEKWGGFLMEKKMVRRGRVFEVREKAERVFI